ncbi:MAG: LPS-assembly protein LptD [Planctomycetales bacterium]|nr:LPS-assembly protein LptD [Planctomycetales bacterium]
MLVISLPAIAAVEVPIEEQAAEIVIHGKEARTWEQGSYEVWHVRGGAEIRQGKTIARAPEAIFWIDRADAFSGQPSKVIAYFEGNGSEKVNVQFGPAGNPDSLSRNKPTSLTDRTWLGRFHTQAGIQIAAPLSGQSSSQVAPAIFERGLEARSPNSKMGDVAPAQFAVPRAAGEEIAPPTAQPIRPANRRVRFFPRGHGRWQVKSFNDPVAGEQVTLLTSGVQIAVEGIDQIGNASLEADNIVLWSPKLDLLNPAGREIREGETHYEVYLEGNIVFRQGDRVIYAERMYYNITREYGVVLNAEMLTPVKDYQGMLRMRARVLEQRDAQHFAAMDADLTSSRLGVPRYRLASGNVMLEDIQRPLLDPFTQQPLVDPVSGEPEVNHQLMATSQNNFIYLAETPVFYWPTIATDLTNPNYYLDRTRVKSDRVYGQQLLLDWDVHQLLGMQNKIPGTKWGLSTDFLSQRGIGVGTDYHYALPSFLGIPGQTTGFIDSWTLLHEKGTDNLGFDRRVVPPGAEFRGRTLANHRQQLPYGWQLTGEFGWVSDFNFLEQYYEREWDTLKDQTTGVELKKLYENMSFNLSADARLNPYFMQTQRLPRFDYFMFGQPIAWDRATFSTHTFASYDHLLPAGTPNNPVDQANFSPLPGEVDRLGMRAATRNEIDIPLEAGPVKVVPYVLGEAAYWGSDINDQSTSRVYGQAGVRASLPLWRSDPNIQSELLNLNGLAQKLVFDVDAFVADSSQDLTMFPRYDSLDDDSTEHFRRRMPVNTFGQPNGTFAPIKYDDRFFAFRNNLQGSVASPVTEIAGSLTEVRMGLRQRFQTKRGLPGQERLVDWMSAETNAVFFPNSTRDNFGSSLGLVDYNFAWHVGDRVTLLSDGFYDFFDGGLQQVTVGGLMSRPEYGNVYVGYRSTDGPIVSSVVVASVSYRMSEKWIATGGTSVDFSKTGNIGQTMSFTRVGESFLVRLGMNYDASRNNVGFIFGIEPRFLPGSRLGRVGGVQIPPAGALGLE